MLPYRVLSQERALGSFDTPENRVSPGLVEKFLFELDDKNAIEAILIGTFGPRMAKVLDLDSKVERRTGRPFARHVPYLQRKIRYESCVSTQVGCALGCTFCASTLVPFLRNLSEAELHREIASIESVIPAGGTLKKVVFAGVGEPLQNYEAVASVVRSLSARGIRSRINTVGVIPYLERMFDEQLPCELIISVHAPDDELRTSIMPVGKGYPLAELARVLKRAPAGMLIEAKYLMLRGLNDSLEQADQLAVWARDLPVMVTLQMYNPIAEFNYQAADPEQVRRFAERLRSHGIQVGMLNSNIGNPVQGGCGQLRARVRPGAKRPRLNVVS